MIVPTSNYVVQCDSCGLYLASWTIVGTTSRQSAARFASYQDARQRAVSEGWADDASFPLRLTCLGCQRREQYARKKAAATDA